jgi:M6 family metalloprotease-like protein
MKPAASLGLIILFLFSSAARAQILPPKPGIDMPQAYFDQIANDKTAFQFRNAWIQRAARIKQDRQAFLAAGNSSIQLLPPGEQQKFVVSGTIAVPVFLAIFNNTASTPYPSSKLRRELFDGPWPTGTVTQLYNEMSYGNLTLTGTVHDWVTLSQDDTYYESGCNGLCESAKTGRFIQDILAANDPTVDFGQYDNDGPDGIPNSGDDDGFADFVAFVHPEIGGECGTSNLWSHRWVVQGWPEFGDQPWQTNDTRNGGGFIKVQDYTIQPAKGCGGAIIEIGVFCHEFGHAFGLPDLYDADGGGEGIGHHGLMGAGNWNSPTNPAHMSAWSKMELGWIVPTVVEPTPQVYTINNVNQNAEAYQLNVMEEKFGRSDTDPIDGSHSLRCGLTSAQAGNRNWPRGPGYGNGWNETIRRDFAYNGNNPVMLEYDVRYDTEANYDFARIKIDVNGAVSTVSSYSGYGVTNNVAVDLTPYLDGSGASSYQIIAEFTSDRSYSDEDGLFDSGANGPFKLDNILLTGGGESYSTDFEQYEDGWYYDFNKNPHREFFLVENRSKAGLFDQSLHSEGLMIWHIEQNVIHSLLKNTGGTNGTTNLVPAGVTLEEADALRHLLLGANRGDTGDVCPGSTGSTAFSNSTAPNSLSHDGAPTNALVNDVSLPGAQMTATMRGGWFAPWLSSITPNSGEPNTVVSITDLAGSGMVHGSTFFLRDASLAEYPASGVQWVGKARLTGDLDLSGVPNGTYDVVVRMPDGQEAALVNGFLVNAAVPVLIQTFYATVDGESVELAWDVWSDEAINGFNIVRREAGSTSDRIINQSPIAPNKRRFVDDTTIPGRKYEYALLVVLGDGSELRSRSVSAQAASPGLELFQNDPNPFNPLTRIRFSLPTRSRVTLTVYDIRGKRVTTLLDGIHDAGVNEIIWDGRNAHGAPVATGVYFYQLRAGKKLLTKKLTILK